MRWPHRLRVCRSRCMKVLARPSWVLGCVLVSATIPAHAQSEILSDFQSWDELEVSARLSSNVDFSWVSQGRFSAGYSNPATYLTGGDLKVGAGRYLEITPSYYYLGFITVTDRRGQFQVPMLAGTVRDTWRRWTVGDRNRFMGAIGGGSDFWIYVNRPRIDCSVGSSRLGTSLFAWDEMFYVSLFHQWTRNRFASGIKKSLNERWAAEVYYLRQDDSKFQPRRINGLGITLEVRLR